MPMKDTYANEDFLARWIADDLSEEELSGFKTSDVYKEIMAIDDAAKSLSVTEIDVEKALSLVTSKNQNTQKENKVKRLWVFSAAAACIAILFVGYTYFYGTRTYSTGIGEKETLLLADGSIIELNANSTVSYKRFNWEEDRAVDFDGEAFFDIKSGKGFTVNTNKGTVSVSGTQFNINNRRDLKVQCYEGSITFSPMNANLPGLELTQGMEIQVVNGKIHQKEISESTPDWTNGFSSFSEQPLSEVLDELMLQYPVEFRWNSIDVNRKFTGNFTHNNLENALKTTMEPMGIEYHVSADKRIVTLSE
ncbi:FecR family protein [[Muricauda] lutisoli]|uniref:FecR domain-containing protein n=1 Tax=[Muricauda] lutisoli TaxID=2816035 RepID=A0ABS3EYA1_9FLAO|nr:FecR domain-containing protein [[Muricauda] lutisoli]MBO0331235.1 FecR domain-containing protein [[Muricauda] lutisoli]